MNLLRRWEIGPFFRSFSLNRTRYSPQMIEKLSSISHAPRYDPLSPTGSQERQQSLQESLLCVTTPEDGVGI